MLTDLEILQAKVDELMVLPPIVARLDARVHALELLLELRPEPLSLATIGKRAPDA